MNPTAPDNSPRPEPQPECETNSLNTVDYFFFNAVGDTTVRPMRSPVLRQTRPDQLPPPSPEKT